MQQAIRRERWLSIAAHLGVLASLGWAFGAAAAVRAYVVPVFFVFPVAFMLNRLGQHYDIDPADVAKWGTLMRSNWFWNLAFLNSNLHLEHHYFPGVPYYRLPALQRALLPFYEQRGDAVADLPRPVVRLVRAEQGAAHRLALSVTPSHAPLEARRW